MKPNFPENHQILATELRRINRGDCPILEHRLLAALMYDSHGTVPDTKKRVVPRSQTNLQMRNLQKKR